MKVAKLIIELLIKLFVKLILSIILLPFRVLKVLFLALEVIGRVFGSTANHFIESVLNETNKKEYGTRKTKEA